MIFYWDGAGALSELALKGTSKPDKCRFTQTVEKREVLDVIEIIKCTDEAVQNIQSVKVWTEHK